MNTKNTSSGFALVAGLLIVIIVAVLGFGGWYVYNQQKDNKNTKDSSEQSLNGTQKTSTEDLSLEIPELGLKINDPDSRKLSIEKVDIQSPYDSGVATVSVVTPADYREEYRNICKHPSYIDETTADNTAKNVTKIGNRYYIIGGTILGCGGTEEMNQYLTELQTYIIKNITTL